MNYEKAFALFERGNFIEATKLSLIAINEGKFKVEETPYFQCKLVSAFYIYQSGKKDVAYKEIINLMKIGMDNFDIRNLLQLVMGQSNQKYKPKLLFGLGTGRSGSTSLTSMLQNIKKSYISHEHPILIPWKDGISHVDWHINRMLSLGEHYDVVGDIAHWWLPYVDYILERHPNSIFIATKRSRSETISSFLNIKGGDCKGSINHWLEHDGNFYKKNLWDKCYPNYSSQNRVKEAIGEYWDEYYSECTRLEKKYLGLFKTITLDELNKKGFLSEILKENKIKGPLNFELKKLNIAGIQEGDKMVPIPTQCL